MQIMNYYIYLNQKAEEFFGLKSVYLKAISVVLGYGKNKSKCQHFV